MKPAPFEYAAPQSVEEALDIIHEQGYDAKLLAGGQSLVPMMNFRLSQPAWLVDLNGLPDLNKITLSSDGGLRIDALVRQSQLERNPLVSEFAPLLHEAVPHIAHPQIRNRGTVGGTLAHADPAAELPAVMVALQAKFRLRRSEGERWVTAEDFFQGLFVTDCDPAEILLEVALPPWQSGTGYAFQEMARRHGDYALSGVAALVSLDANRVCTNARLVYLSAGEVPMVAYAAADLLVGQQPTAELIAEVAETATTKEIAPMDDIHATADFKRHLARVLTKRAINQALENAAA